jgi:uncharacterized protein YcbK (DUF882 family)
MVSVLRVALLLVPLFPCQATPALADGASARRIRSDRSTTSPRARRAQRLRARRARIQQLDAALAALPRIKVKDLPPEVYRRHGYERRYHHLTLRRVTPQQRSLALVGEIPVEHFLSPELRFPGSWLYTSLNVPTGVDEYLLIDRRVLVKLLLILEQLQRGGFDPRAFTIISAHRTERVNQHLYRYRMKTFGATALARRSYHLRGQALDLIIGDLDRDGRVSYADHEVMICAIRAAERIKPRLRGGLGLYRGSIHTDVRGHAAHWCGKRGNRSPLCRTQRRIRCRRVLRRGR